MPIDRTTAGSAAAALAAGFVLGGMVGDVEPEVEDPIVESKSGPSAARGVEQRSLNAAQQHASEVCDMIEALGAIECIEARDEVGRLRDVVYSMK